MTSLALAGRAGGDAGERPVPWRRMAWVTWRQHRFALGAVVAFLGSLAVYLWFVGLQLHHAYASAAACHPAAAAVCNGLASNFDGMDQVLSYGYLLQAVPALIGAFVGAPLLARELETGTFRYAWTQGFGRWRWALAKLVALAVVMVAFAGAISLLFSWYYRPYLAAGNRALSLDEWSPLAGGLFDVRGVAFAAWALAAFAIGALAGMLIRRVVPAIAATLAGYTGLALVSGLYLRKHYLAPLFTTNSGRWVSPGSAWIISQQWVAEGGRPVSQSALGLLLQRAAPELAGKGGVPKALGSVRYLMQHGYTLWTTYQPGSRFWPFQWIETGWLAGLSLLLLSATIWLVRRRAT
jgi:ABC-2 family transporter protein